jgi:hypothetical protein
LTDDLSTDTQYLKSIKAACEALAALISAGKLPVDTEITATLDPAGLATQATLEAVLANQITVLANQAEHTALLESILEQLDAIA